MTRAGASETRSLLLLHVLLMFAMAGGWAYYCWRESSLAVPTTTAAHPTAALSLEHAFVILEACLSDVLLGFCSLFVFAVGTGAYVRRLQTWLDARASGEAVAYGSAQLKDQALAANRSQGARR